MASPSEVTHIARGNNSFAFKLSQELKKCGESGNQVFSPISVSTVMGMLYNGAKGKTAEQIQKGMCFPDDRNVLNREYQAFMEFMKEGNLNVTLEMANQIYAQNNYEILPAFHKSTQDHFGAAMETLDFCKNEEAAKIINTWVEDKTHKKITDLIAASDLGEDTRLVLVNAIYFKGDWREKFDLEATQPQDFHVDSKEVIRNVPMMHIMKEFPFTNLPKLDAKLLALPYKGDRIQMLIFLPNKIDGLESLMEKLTTVSVDTLLATLCTTEVQITLPRFKLEATMNLEEPMQQVGMTEMFQESADLRGISKSGRLYVSKAVQKAFIEVNEEGSEAAAATGMEILTCCYGPERPQIWHFHADHPFLFAIYDVQTKSVLFLGKLIRPHLEDETVGKL